MPILINRNQNEKNTSFEMNNISKLLQKRIILFSQSVDDEMCNLIVGQLLFLENENSTNDIRLFINSPGGSVTAGLSLYDTMQNLQPDVSTICFGLAASMGAVLLSAGVEKKRFAFASSRIMIHQPLSKVEAPWSHLDIQIRNGSYFKSVLNNILSFHTKQELSQIEKDTERDFFLSAKEAKEYGIIDDILI
uniref:ATP-dependent Clp protease proteolytic subunit n=1 Tax=Cyanophora biloba TaxID=1489483 RepID=A0A2Z4HG89_9EUKA|nr:ATP-dependent Clp protease proteolytic subunit [Cyanophora biloba]AWW13809.1 ATP-dependent Clp protease proteolytic subunit [Cyanophora biloba]